LPNRKKRAAVACAAVPMQVKAEYLATSPTLYSEFPGAWKAASYPLPSCLNPALGHMHIRTLTTGAQVMLNRRGCCSCPLVAAAVGGCGGCRGPLCAIWGPGCEALWRGLITTEAVVLLFTSAAANNLRNNV